jgi:hypothetical protein
MILYVAFPFDFHPVHPLEKIGQVIMWAANDSRHSLLKAAFRDNAFRSTRLNESACQ